MVSTTQIKAGLSDYAYAHLLPKFEPWKQFVAGTAIGALGGKAEALVQGLAKNPAIVATGLIQENGLVDLDAIYKGALEQIQRQGTLPVDIPMIGRIVFGPDDIQAIYQSISRA
jgi:hypothetical protein